ncbi:hypothetical protein AIOL_002026 [Candidatus Rhodobacter oscarellae]|uniref:DUF2852 domain-containing protein n=1 Tax=Candidatus Rhodobacter oscarellae TaxID=1675527 RepID=A0A0J9GU33_9RHOB|nr:DUF2852 domain-containing protein [Candidatus Rhodobacter lobularis]KMW57068.1 hypothetical protein AIOL_002026 [Candidatus Rhodobacter lobularis]
MSITMTADHHHAAHTGPQPSVPRPMPVVVQILSTLMFGAFSIIAVVMAFHSFWLAGFVIAAILGWRGGFVPGNFNQVSADEIAERVRALSPEAQHRSSGNTSFDAYRGDMLRRLEEEQDNFDGFLTRLREAKDRSEFDTFMDERASKARREAIEVHDES